MANWHFFVLKVTVNPSNPNAEPQSWRQLYSTKDGEKLFIGGGNQYTFMRYFTNAEKVADYGWIDLTNEPEKRDEIVKRFLREFPPGEIDIRTLDGTKEATDVDGWLSPDGRFFRSGFMSHSNLAYDLCLSFFPDEEPDDKVLLNKHWIGVGHGHFFYGWHQPASQAQLDWIAILRQMNKGFDHYIKGIDKFLKYNVLRFTPINGE